MTAMDTSESRAGKSRVGFLRSTPARVAKVTILIAILIFVPPLIDNPYIIRIFISAVMLGVMAAIYDLMIGYAGLVNFGYAGFIAVGAYTSALGEFHYGIGPWLALLTGGLLAAFVGFLVRRQRVGEGKSV